MSLDKQTLELVIESAVNKSLEKIRGELKTDLREITDSLKRYIEERDEWLLDKIKKDLQQEIGRFKDKAIEESEGKTLQYFQSTFNLDPRNDSDRKKRQDMDAFVGLAMKQVGIFLKAVVFLVFAAIITAAAMFGDFRVKWWGWF
jgi:hypothetical protein